MSCRVRLLHSVFLIAVLGLMVAQAAVRLDSPNQHLRDLAAARARLLFKPSSRESWQPLLDQLTKGLDLESIKKLVGPVEYQDRPAFGYMNGTVYVWRLDDTWMLRFTMGRFEPGLLSAELVHSFSAYSTSPPDNFSGVWRDYYCSGGVRFETPYQEGKRHGLHKSFNDDGSLYQTEQYENGVMHGPSKGYHANGRLRFEGQHHHGKRRGRWVSYNEDGTVYSETNETGDDGAVASPQAR